MSTEFYKYIYTVNWGYKNKPIRICKSLIETGLVKQIGEMKRTDETTPRFIASRRVNYCGNGHWGVFHEIAIMKISDVQEFAITLGKKSLKNICGVNFKYSCRTQACNFTSKLIIP